MLYATHFSHAENPNYFYAGGSNINEARIYSIETKKVNRYNELIYL